MATSMEYLKHQHKINLGYDDVDVVKAKLVIEEIEDDSNPVRLPDDDRNYTLKFVSEDEQLVASRDEISYAVWLSIKEGRLKDGDWVGIETECITHVQGNGEKPDGSWTPIFSEALATLYTKIKKDQCGRVKVYDLCSIEMKHLEEIGKLKTQLGFFEGALQGILMSNDVPKRLKQVIKRVLKTKK